MSLIRRVPKHGFTNIFRKEYSIVNLKSLGDMIVSGTITPQALVDVGLVKRKSLPIKILGNGDLTKRLWCRRTSSVSPQRRRFEQLEGESRSSPVFERLLTSFQNIFKIPELRTRILFYHGDAGGVSDRGAYSHAWDQRRRLSDFLQKQGGALLGFLDIFFRRIALEVDDLSAGHYALHQRFDYSSAVDRGCPASHKVGQEGERGRKKIIQYTRFGTIGIAVIQGFGSP